MEEQSVPSLANLENNPVKKTFVVDNAVVFQRTIPRMTSQDAFAVFTRTPTMVCSCRSRIQPPSPYHILKAAICKGEQISLIFKQPNGGTMFLVAPKFGHFTLQRKMLYV